MAEMEGKTLFLGFEIPLNTINIILDLERKILNAIEGEEKNLKIFPSESLFIPFLELENISFEFIELLDNQLNSIVEKLPECIFDLKGVELTPEENLLYIKVQCDENTLLLIKNIIEENGKEIGLDNIKTFLPLKIPVLSLGDNYSGEKLQGLIKNYEDLILDRFSLNNIGLYLFSDEEKRVHILKRYYIGAVKSSIKSAE